MRATLTPCLEAHPGWLLQAAADSRRGELQSLELVGQALKAGLEQHRLQVSWQCCFPAHLHVCRCVAVQTHRPHLCWER
jgi:hypothetical protein